MSIEAIIAFGGMFALAFGIFLYFEISDRKQKTA